MKTFVSTEEMYQAAQLKFDIDLGTDTVPNMSEWHYGTEISIDKIRYWEKIYFKSNDLGIYAAHDPYVEYYIIVPHFFIANIETYYGIDASARVYNRAKEIGIDLSFNRIWTPLEKI
jgi:hypothetical protein